MTPLKLDPTGLPNGLADVQPGDAVVAFSRRSIYNARRVGDLSELLNTVRSFLSVLQTNCTCVSHSLETHLCWYVYPTRHLEAYCMGVSLLPLQDIEAATSQKTCIVYGALPAETRRHQVRRFCG